VYRRKRIHSALDYITAVEFEAAWQEVQVKRALLLRTAENVSNFMGSIQMSQQQFVGKTSSVSGM